MREAAVLFCALFAITTSAKAAVVYDNSANSAERIFRPEGGFSAFGDQIHLAGTDRTITRFLFEYYLSANSNGNERLTLTLYANDGPGVTRTNADGTVSNAPAPGRVLYQSPNLAMMPGYNVADLSGISVLVPDTFTWTVAFQGVDPGEDAGLPLYSPPTVGSSEPDFWLQVNGTWQFVRAPDAASPVDFAARVEAATTAPPLRIEWDRRHQLVVTAACVSAPQKIRKANSLAGPWLPWQNVPAGTKPGDQASFPEAAGDRAAFYSLTRD